MKTILAAIIFLSLPLVIRGGDLDNEIDSFQVELKSAQITSPAKKRKPYRLKKLYRSKSLDLQSTNEVVKPQPVAVEVQIPEPDVTKFDSTPIAQERTEVPYEPSRPAGPPFFYRVTLIPYGVYSTVDGNESEVATNGVQSQYYLGYSGAALLDLNLLNSQKLVLETGIQYTTVGAQIRSIPNSNYYPSYQSLPVTDQVIALGYTGIPLFAKWLPYGERSSTPFFKIGCIPSYLVYKKYYDKGYNSQQYDPYGGTNDYDFLFSASLGYRLTLSNSFSAVLEMGGFQGIIPVVKSYDIYNVGIIGGLGASYLF